MLTRPWSRPLQDGASIASRKPAEHCSERRDATMRSLSRSYRKTSASALQERRRLADRGAPDEFGVSTRRCLTTPRSGGCVI